MTFAAEVCKLLCTRHISRVESATACAFMSIHLIRRCHAVSNPDTAPLCPAETCKRLCYLNTAPDEIIRSLFYNKNNDSLITVSVYSLDNYTSLRCRSTPLECAPTLCLIRPHTLKGDYTANMSFLSIRTAQTVNAELLIVLQ